MTKPYITVITSTYNAAGTLRRCLDSVNSQSYPNIEHIIIDGNSSDGTREIIAEYASKPESRISYWKSEPDSGIYDAWNKALPHINGEWVLFLGADDYYLEDVFSKVVPVLETLANDVVIAYGKIFISDGITGEVLQTYGDTPWNQLKKHFFRGERMLPHPAVCHRHSLFQQRKFDISYRIAGDYDFLYSVLQNSIPIFLDIPIVNFSNTGISSIEENHLICWKENVRLVKKNGGCLSILILLYGWKLLLLDFCRNHNLIRTYKIISNIRKPNAFN